MNQYHDCIKAPNGRIVQISDMEDKIDEFNQQLQNEELSEQYSSYDESRNKYISDINNGNYESNYRRIQLENALERIKRELEHLNRNTGQLSVNSNSDENTVADIYSINGGDDYKNYYISEQTRKAEERTNKIMGNQYHPFNEFPDRRETDNYNFEQNYQRPKKYSKPTPRQQESNNYFGTQIPPEQNNYDQTSDQQYRRTKNNRSGNSSIKNLSIRNPCPNSSRYENKIESSCPDNELSNYSVKPKYRKIRRVQNIKFHK